MKPGKPPLEQDDLLRASLVEMIDLRHELVRLAALISWDVFEREWTVSMLFEHSPEVPSAGGAKKAVSRYRGHDSSILRNADCHDPCLLIVTQN